ncbi:MAG: hypothetical protein IJO89_03495 [Clostridia bacterium]|nr:hypothetical protein [Clostridia bacterium]MBQ9958091.1 hypothetical protein [Clostridia bacterium]
MSEMILNLIIAALAIYGLTCFIRWIWAWVIKRDDNEKILVVPLYDSNLEYSLREAVALVKVTAIKKIAAIDCGLSDESRQIALMFANGEPLVEIINSNDIIENIF